ncbi:hypothetical protein M422DRAFT_162327, partial [Sphaerobolus stellatus SS14]
LSRVVTAADFPQCLQEVREGLHGDEGGTDNNGNPVNIANATALTYQLCLRACGGDQEPFSWSVFSSQLASWLLPWLALVSQLPFGAHDRLENFESVLLTIGSPMLAGYSLVLSVLNERWLRRRLGRCKWPSAKDASSVLIGLQHAPVRITDDGSLLSSLIVLPENDAWWRELSKRLQYAHTWSISAATSIAWVVLSYLFTVVDSFLVTGDTPIADQANGQGIGDLWLWLLPIVLCWLQLSPKSDSQKIIHAMTEVQEMAYVTLPDGTLTKAHTVSGRQGIFLRWPSFNSVLQDEQCPLPIYYYARAFQWCKVTECILLKFRAAEERAQNHLAVSTAPWNHSDTRKGNRQQVRAYCETAEDYSDSVWASGIVCRIVLAFFFTTVLQWGTTGAAIIVLWYTPTRGLGCRSASYVLYGVLSTLSWILFFISSLLAHLVITSQGQPKGRSTHPKYFLRKLSIISRRLGKFVAFTNAICVLINCLLQFGHFFDRCFCKSSVFYLGDRAFAVLAFTQSDLASIRIAWIGGVVLAGGTTLVFVIFVNLLLDSRDSED